MEGDDGIVVVSVNVILGKGLPAHDKNGFSDPYVCVAIETGDRMEKPVKKKFLHHTQIVDKDLDPEWCEVFNLKAKESGQLRLYVFDHNLIHRDAFLAWGEVPLSEVQEAGGYLHEKEVHLKDPHGQEAGVVVVSVTYGTPEKEVPPPRLVRHDRKKEKAKEKAAKRIDAVPPKVQVSEEVIEEARKLGLNGKQVDRAHKYFSMVDQEGIGKISYSDYAELETKIRNKRHRVSHRMQMAMAANAVDQGQRMMFDSVDKNGDGYLTFQEFLGLWRVLEVQLLGQSWNPIKNARNEFGVLKQGYADYKSGNFDANPMYAQQGRRTFKTK